MANRIYPGSTGAPAFAGGYPAHDSSSGSGGDDTSPGNGGSTPPTDDNGTPPTDSGGGDGGGSGVVSVGGSDGGIDVIGGDTNGDGEGLINVHSDAPGGVLGDSLDGTHIDVINPDSLVDAHVPGLVDATVGDGTVADIIGGAADGGSLTDGLHGIQVDALHDGNLLEVHAPGIADATVGGSELGGLTDGLGGATDAVGLGGLAGGDGITVDVLNGEYVAEAHAPGIADATVGGYGELGGLLGNIGDAGDAAGGAAGGLGGTDALHGITVDALNGDYLAEAHVPQIADATVGGAELGNLVGGSELGGVLGGLDLAHDGGSLLGDVLHVGSGGDIAGLDVGHLLDTSSG